MESFIIVSKSAQLSHYATLLIPHQKKEMAPRTQAVNYHLKSKVSITLRC